MNQSLVRKGLFILVFLLQMGALGHMIYGRVQLLAHGRPLLLKCEPVDPRSLLSGDYVILNYEISNFTLEEMRAINIHEESFKSGEDVYLAVTADRKEDDGSGPFARPLAISTDRSKLTEHEIVIKGRARSDFEPTDYEGMENSFRVMGIRFGVEEYFVPQFEGLEIEKEIADTHVEVAVGEDGTAAIRRLFVKGKEVEFH